MLFSVKKMKMKMKMKTILKISYLFLSLLTLAIGCNKDDSAGPNAGNQAPEVASDENGKQTEIETFAFETQNLNDAQQAGSFVARVFTNAVESNGKLWVVGGSDNNGLKNDVWFSEDGTNWNQVYPHANFSERRGHISFVFDKKIWVMIGRDNFNFHNDVW